MDSEYRRYVSDTIFRVSRAGVVVAFGVTGTLLAFTLDADGAGSSCGDPQPISSEPLIQGTVIGALLAAGHLGKALEAHAANLPLRERQLGDAAPVALGALLMKQERFGESESVRDVRGGFDRATQSLLFAAGSLWMLIYVATDYAAFRALASAMHCEGQQTWFAPTALVSIRSTNFSMCLRWLLVGVLVGGILLALLLSPVRGLLTKDRSKSAGATQSGGFFPIRRQAAFRKSPIEEFLPPYRKIHDPMDYVIWTGTYVFLPFSWWCGGQEILMKIEEFKDSTEIPMDGKVFLHTIQWFLGGRSARKRPSLARHHTHNFDMMWFTKMSLRTFYPSLVLLSCVVYFHARQTQLSEVLLPLIVTIAAGIVGAQATMQQSSGREIRMKRIEAINTTLQYPRNDTAQKRIAHMGRLLLPEYRRGLREGAIDVQVLALQLEKGMLYPPRRALLKDPFGTISRAIVDFFDEALMPLLTVVFLVGLTVLPCLSRMLEERTAGDTKWRRPWAWPLADVFCYAVYVVSIFYPDGFRLVLHCLECMRVDFKRIKSSTDALLRMLAPAKAYRVILPGVNFHKHAEVEAWVELSLFVDKSRPPWVQAASIGSAVAFFSLILAVVCATVSLAYDQPPTLAAASCSNNPRCTSQNLTGLCCPPSPVHGRAQPLLDCCNSGLIASDVYNEHFLLLKLFLAWSLPFIGLIIARVLVAGMSVNSNLSYREKVLAQTLHSQSLLRAHDEIKAKALKQGKVKDLNAAAISRYKLDPNAVAELDRAAEFTRHVALSWKLSQYRYKILGVPLDRRTLTPIAAVLSTALGFMYHRASPGLHLIYRQLMCAWDSNAQGCRLH